MDRLTPPQRSRVMGRVRNRDTKPELIVRRLIHRLGYRFRLHVRGLPGTPDLVFPGRRKVIFVHGCFWHRHEGCRAASTPATRQSFWEAKFERNKQRDRQVIDALERSGYQVLVIWTCELRPEQRLRDRLTAFLGERLQSLR